MVVSYKLVAVEQNSRSNHVGRKSGAIDCACRPTSIPRRFYFVAPIQFRNGVARTNPLVIAWCFWRRSDRKLCANGPQRRFLEEANQLL